MKPLSLLLGVIATLLFGSCLNDKEVHDWSETVEMEVSSQLGEYRIWGMEPTDAPLSGIQVRETSESDWQVLPLTGIEGFDYEEGYAYRLKVEKTHLANPPADASNIRYKLLEVLSKQAAE